jgi:hypothetical protein
MHFGTLSKIRWWSIQKHYGVGVLFSNKSRSFSLLEWVAEKFERWLLSKSVYLARSLHLMESRNILKLETIVYKFKIAKRLGHYIAYFLDASTNEFSDKVLSFLHVPIMAENPWSLSYLWGALRVHLFLVITIYCCNSFSLETETVIKDTAQHELDPWEWWPW